MIKVVEGCDGAPPCERCDVDVDATRTTAGPVSIPVCDRHAAGFANFFGDDLGGFQMTFDNGYTMSVRFGANPGVRAEWNPLKPECFTGPTAEVAVLDSDFQIITIANDVSPDSLAELMTCLRRVRRGDFKAPGKMECYVCKEDEDCCDCDGGPMPF